MPPNDKIKMSKQEFEENYEVEDTKDLPGTKAVEKEAEPEFLTEEEQEHEEELFADLGPMEDTE